MQFHGAQGLVFLERTIHDSVGTKVCDKVKNEKRIQNLRKHIDTRK